MPKNKKKNYKLRSKVYKRLGTSTIGLTTFGGFFAYETATDWSNFKTELDNFIVVNTETMKVNLFIAFPLLISALVFVWVYRKKNEEALKGKVSFSLLFIIMFLWFIYSVIEVSLMSLVGAFIGSLIDEQIFTPLSKSAKLKAMDDHEIALEVRREKARKRARDDIDGTV